MTFNLGSHLNETDIAAYLDGVTKDAERRSVETHLASCDECRMEVAASQEAISTAPSAATSSKIPMRWVGLFAAAALTVVAVSTLSRTTSDKTTERGTAAEFPAVQRAVAIVTPSDNSRMGSDRRLVWRSEGSGATYRITIGDESGQPLHSAALPDTSFAIPATLTLVPGRKYFWYVDAITNEGTTATSGLNSFTID